MENSNGVTYLDSSEVQICKPITVVNDRIENFLKRKREENHDRNTRMYCNSISSTNYSGASRTCNTIEAKRQRGSECFVKKTIVQNNVGPLNNGGLDLTSSNSYNLSNNRSSIGLKPDVQERISNLEKVLNIKSDDSKSNIDIYNKLKSIEDHVLKLESILLNINENYSLSNIFSIDKDLGIIKHNNTKADDLMNQKKFVEDSLIRKEIKSEILPQKSKYSANEIQELINSIK
ncbi:hypothetical protein AGLY_014465 [Aphis glycines]|uniref:Uncharacterized protein n=1 Tax=Aphis glycines TaxID=307491 RepID=A0A6G0T559_APHGL|nr:hypothetical protein AGLY_014465 [Aphis glycines]